MSEKPTLPTRLQNPKSDEGVARSAEALRANLLKRKAQKRARTDQDAKADGAPPKPDQAD
jgi:hypothetical protein